MNHVSVMVSWLREGNAAKKHCRETEGLAYSCEVRYEWWYSVNTLALWIICLLMFFKAKPSHVWCVFDYQWTVNSTFYVFTVRTLKTRHCFSCPLSRRRTVNKTLCSTHKLFHLCSIAMTLWQTCGEAEKQQRHKDQAQTNVAHGCIKPFQMISLHLLAPY